MRNWKRTLLILIVIGGAGQTIFSSINRPRVPIPPAQLSVLMSDPQSLNPTYHNPKVIFDNPNHSTEPNLFSGWRWDNNKGYLAVDLHRMNDDPQGWKVFLSGYSPQEISPTYKVVASYQSPLSGKNQLIHVLTGPFSGGYIDTAAPWRGRGLHVVSTSGFEKRMHDFSGKASGTSRDDLLRYPVYGFTQLKSEFCALERVTCHD